MKPNSTDDFKSTVFIVVISSWLFALYWWCKRNFRWRRKTNRWFVCCTRICKCWLETNQKLICQQNKLFSLTVPKPVFGIEKLNGAIGVVFSGDAAGGLKLKPPVGIESLLVDLAKLKFVVGLLVGFGGSFAVGLEKLNTGL